MPLNNITRDQQFFQDLRDSNVAMKANDFDTQFNQVVNYINNNLIAFINALAGGAGTGVLGQPNTFLRNVGDGTTQWAAVNSDAFQDYTIEFAKLAQATTPCTILASDVNQAFTQVTSLNSNEVLISTNNDVPTWGKANTNIFENRGITGIKIGLGTITNEHLQPGILINNLRNKSIINDKFTDNSVTANKFSLGSLESRNFSIIPLTGYNFPNNGLFDRNNFKLGTITPNKIQDGQISAGHFNVGKFITRGKIAPGTVSEKTFVPMTTVDQSVITGYFTSAMLNPNFKLTGRELALDKFFKNMFEPTAEQAFTAKGC